MARGQEPNEPGWYITRRGDRRYWDGSAWGPTEAEYYQRQSLVNAALATSPYIGLDTSGESADDHAARLAAEEAAVAGYARRLRGRGSLLVYLGLVLACVVLVVTIGILSEGGGGIVWYGGVLLGLLLVWRGIRHWRAARDLGIRTGGLRWAIFGVLALVAASLAAGAGAVYYVGSQSPGAVSQPLQPSDVGTCWTRALEGGPSEQVDCTSPKAGYRAISLQVDPQTCPDTGAGYLEFTGQKEVLCLLEIK